MPRPPRPLPHLDSLRETFSYGAYTGDITSRVTRTSRKKGECADCIVGRYKMVYINGGHYYSHRVAWALFFGMEPGGFIDHIDGDRLNNRISNLRVTTHPMNMCNRPAPKHNTSGVKGVHHRRDNGKWRVTINVNRKHISLGEFTSLEEAKSVIGEARHRLHGKFAKY